MAKRIEHLDALRGIAALAVFAGHLVYPLTVSPDASPLLKQIVSSTMTVWFNPGRFGVVLFFMLSGYVIPLSFRGDRPYFDFAVGRLFRLYPAYWLSVAAIALIAPFTAQPAFGAFQLLANLTMVQKVLGQADVNGVYWSLFIEIVFYACCVGLFAIGRLIHSWTLALVCIACIAASALPLLANVLLDQHLPAGFLPHYLAFLFFGGLVRNAVAQRDRTAVLPLVLAGLAILASIPIENGMFFPVVGTAGSEFGFTAGSVAAMVLFVLACRVNLPRGRVLVWLGAISYAVYVLHTGCIWIAETIVPITDGRAAFLYATIAIALTLAVSELCFRYVERPCISLGLRVRFGGRSGLAVASGTPR